MKNIIVYEDSKNNYSLIKTKKAKIHDLNLNFENIDNGLITNMYCFKKGLVIFKAVLDKNNMMRHVEIKDNTVDIKLVNFVISNM